MPQPFITAITIHQFRNIVSAQLKTAPINIISGDNGSGKSSLLEALYYLSHLKSFRTSKPQRLIHHDYDHFILNSTISLDKDTHNIGLQRTSSHNQTLKLNGETTKAQDIAYHLPMQFIDTQCHQYFTGGPEKRRQYLNWGLFHMKHSFLSTWKACTNLLKQRNAALKLRQLNELDCWDHQWIPLCESIHEMRENYIEDLNPIFIRLIKELLNTEYPQVELRYQAGWNSDKPLALLLQERQYKDAEIGYTQLGPHRADLQMFINKRPAQDYLSQGQMKLSAYALKIAQSILQKESIGKSPIFLIDDIQAELDSSKQDRIIQLISDLHNQCFYTALAPNKLLKSLNSNNEITQFHVKHGEFLASPDQAIRQRSPEKIITH